MYERLRKVLYPRNDLSHVILHVETNQLDPELPPERISKLVIGVAKNLQTDTRAIGVSSIISHNKN